MHEKDWLDQIGEAEKAEMEEGLILVEWAGKSPLKITAP